MFLSQLLCVSLTDSFPTCSDYLLFSLLRAVVAILDSFHFKVTEEHQDSEPPAEQQEEEKNDEDEKMEDETSASSLPQRIHSTILNTILPGLESCLTKEVLLASLFSICTEELILF